MNFEVELVIIVVLLEWAQMRGRECELYKLWRLSYVLGPSWVHIHPQTIYPRKLSLKMDPQSPHRSHNPEDESYVHLYMGPMCAGKTARLIKHLQMYQDDGDHADANKPLVIKHAIDALRYPNQNALISRNGEMWEGVYLVSDLSAFYREHTALVDMASIIVIDEVQFFDSVQLRYWLPLWRRMGKRILLSGLNGDANQAAWPSITAILPFASRVIVCTAQCAQCNAPALYSYRYPTDLDAGQDELTAPLPPPQIHVVDADTESKTYEPRCDACLLLTHLANT